DRPVSGGAPRGVDVARLFRLAGDAGTDLCVGPGSPRPRALQWRGRTLHVPVARGARAADRDSEADSRVGGQNAITVAESIHQTGHLSQQKGTVLATIQAQ